MKIGPYLAMTIAAFAVSAMTAAPGRAGEAVATQNTPPPVAAAIRETVETCKPQQAQLSKGFVTRRDVNGDGIADFVLDYSAVGCGENQTAFCGSLGCAVDIYASLPDGTFTKALQEYAHQFTFRRVAGRPAVILAEVNGKHTFYWNGKTFSATRSRPAKAALSATAVASGNHLDVPVMEEGGDGQAANCASSTVFGLKAGGDGFLAVRSGPGTQYRKLDELHNGDVVLVFENRGNWAGIVYKAPAAPCHSTKTHAVTFPNKGWVNAKWLKPLAG